MRVPCLGAVVEPGEAEAAAGPAEAVEVGQEEEAWACPVAAESGGGDDSHSAGTSQIATDTGGDTMRVDDASALQDTLSRLRQRYALYFYFPEGVRNTDDPNIRVDLAQEARIHFAQAEIRYRHAPMSGNGQAAALSGSTHVTHAPEPTVVNDDNQPTVYNTTKNGRRAAVNEDSSDHVILNTGSDDAGTPSAPPSGTAKPPASTPPPPQPGWPRANPPNNPQ